MPARDELSVSIAWQRHVDGDVGPASVLGRAITRYREPWRVYHGVGHLIRVIQAIDDGVRDAVISADDMHDRGAVVAAAVFHDAIYDPRRSDNETASADLARRELATLDGWTASRCRRVGDMIERTAGHHGGGDLDTAVLIAADLAILAASPARYDEYCTGVRREYAHVDDARWTSGRSAVLRDLLDRSAIYPDQLGLRRWEARARANISAEIASLSEGRSAAT